MVRYVTQRPLPLAGRRCWEEIGNGEVCYATSPAFGRETLLGRKVRLKLDAYPFEQFGALEGKIEAIQQASTDSGFFAKVSLPDSLVTQYNKPVFFREGLIAQAEIITENLNLLQRLYYNAVKSLKR